jgi:cation transport ATPase
MDIVLQQPEFVKLTTVANNYHDLCNWVSHYDTDMYTCAEIEEQVARVKLNLDEIEATIAKLCGLKELKNAPPEPAAPEKATGQNEPEYDLKTEIITVLVYVPLLSGAAATFLALSVKLWDKPITYGHLLAATFLSALLYFMKIVWGHRCEMPNPDMKMKFSLVVLLATALLVLSVVLLLEFAFKISLF